MFQKVTLTAQNVADCLIPLNATFCQEANGLLLLVVATTRQQFDIQWGQNGFTCPQLFNATDVNHLRANARVGISINPPLESEAPDGRQISLSIFFNPLGNAVPPAKARRTRLDNPIRKPVKKARRTTGNPIKEPVNSADYELPEDAGLLLNMVLLHFINTVEGENGGWAQRLSSYRYAKMNASSLNHIAQFWSDTGVPFKNLCQHPGADWNGEQFRRQLELYSETICIWGGVAQTNGYVNAWRVAKSAIEGAAPDGAPMSSGWTKVAAFASEGLTHEQTIWDSRVSVSVIGGIHRALNDLNLERNALQVPWLRQIRIVKSQAEGRNKRITNLGKAGWSVGACDWPSHFGGSALVRRITRLVATQIPFPQDLPAPFGNQWNLFTVGMALFMDGK